MELEQLLGYRFLGYKLKFIFQLNNDKKCSIDTLAEYVYIEKIGAPLEVNIFKKII